MRLFSLLLCVLTTSVFAGPMRATVSMDRRGGASCTSSFPKAQDLCTAMGSYQTGNWWCLKGDGTMLNGSATTLSPSGTLTTAARIVCPSGGNCTPETQTILNPTSATPDQNYASPTVAPPAGTFTTCVLGMTDTLTKQPPDGLRTTLLFYGPGDDTTVKPWIMDLADSQTATGLTISTKNIVNVNDNVTQLARQYTLYCGVFTSSTSVTSCTYNQGASSATCVTGVHATAAITATAMKWIVGLSENTVSAQTGWHGLFRGAFMTEQALAASDIAAIGAAVLPYTQAGMTFARASDKTCCVGDQCTLIGANVPCITNCVVQLNNSTKNYSQNTERPTGWVLTSAGGAANPVTTLDVVPSKWGITNADSVLFDATTASQLSEINVTTSMPNPSSEMYFSVDLKGTTSGSIDFSAYAGGSLFKDGNQNGNSTCSFVSTKWTTCTYSSTISPATAITLVRLGHLSTLTGTAYPSQTTVYINNAQTENVQYTPYIRVMSGSTTTRAIETCTGTGCP